MPLRTHSGRVSAHQDEHPVLQLTRMCEQRSCHRPFPHLLRIKTLCHFPWVAISLKWSPCLVDVVTGCLLPRSSLSDNSSNKTLTVHVNQRLHSRFVRWSALWSGCLATFISRDVYLRDQWIWGYCSNVTWIEHRYSIDRLFFPSQTCNSSKNLLCLPVKWTSRCLCSTFSGLKTCTIVCKRDW